MDDFFAEEEDIFKAEAKAFERAGPSGKLDELLSTVKTGKKGIEIISLEDRFLINTDALCRHLNSENIIKITETDINNILESTMNITGLKYKNYIGYTLGYLASEGGKSLKKERVKYVIKEVLPRVSTEKGVSPADVVRYARFWTIGF